MTTSIDEPTTPTSNIINKIDYSKLLLEQKEVKVIEKLRESVLNIRNIKREYKEYIDVEEDGIVYLLTGNEIQKINKEKKKQATKVIKNIQKDMRVLKKMNLVKGSVSVEECFCTEEFINRFSEKLNKVM